MTDTARIILTVHDAFQLAELRAPVLVDGTDRRDAIAAA